MGTLIFMDDNNLDDPFAHLSPAEKMAAFKEEMAITSSSLQEFIDESPFPLDAFQREALREVALGSSVLVAAPTGAGKTVVGEGAVYLSVRDGDRAFYTTPIKALSNQKYHDFCERFGESEVGLLTGDTTINPHASIVVMTTEVLRNMIYAGTDLSALRVVVLDEIHYLADRVRGPVWEEVLIQLPQHIQTVALSATVSNLDEFGSWIKQVRGTCSVVVSHDRPVPLYQHMMVGRRIYDLFAAESLTKETRLLNPDLLQAVDESSQRSVQGKWGSQRTRAPRSGRMIPKRLNRPRVAESLDRDGLLPAIVFVFSRAGCEDAVQAVLSSSVHLTDEFERRQIAQVVDEALLRIPVADHAILGLSSWKQSLESGVAAHHAGLLPIMKETVEQLFLRGLVKLVYATETLALGVNMPAKTVVIESLEKWNGSEHVRLNPAEYTQLTGRAGRRGIDVEGHAVVPFRGVVQPEELAQLASRRDYQLKSAFFPNYNMVVNLLRHSTRAKVRETLEASFAQYQADDKVVALAARLRKLQSQQAELASAVTCDVGDVKEYFRLRASLTAEEKKLSVARKKGDFDYAVRVLSRFRPGAAFVYKRGRRLRSGVVLVGADSQSRNPAIRLLGEDAKVFTLSASEISSGPYELGYIRVPRTGVRRLRDRQAVAKQLRALQRSSPKPKERRNTEVERLERRIGELEQQLRNHPVHQCEDREKHASDGYSWMKIEREVQRVSAKINAQTSSIAHDFDRVCRVLEALGFIRGDDVTSRGEQLCRLFGERDLLVAEAVCENVFGALSAEEMAALASSLVYEPRTEAARDADLKLPSPGLQEAWSLLSKNFERINHQEKAAQLERVNPPAGQLIAVTYRWAKGATLTACLTESELLGGDFVRWMRQTIDLLEQMRRLPDPVLAQKARKAADKIRRGVVGWE